MKKKYQPLLIIIFTLSFIIFPNLILAAQSSSSANINQGQLVRLQKAVLSRENGFKKVMDFEEKLLDKLQIRINKAKDGGKDVSSANVLLADVRAKMTDAKIRLSDIDLQKNSVSDKAGIDAIGMKFKMVRENLYAIRRDMAEIIKILKSFNSTTSKGNNSQK